ncbi:MerR family transcriptional regulator [[Clostridium] spiroforme]|nr:MerR family transcriptional regulator [Thomasclavelia spiroformis]
MKTKELEKRLGITKDTLRFYEKEGLVKPLRDENGYRHYREEDVRIIEIIMFFRSIEFTIDEIKQLFAGTISISDLMVQKKKYLERIIDHKKRTIDIIVQTLDRKKAYFGFLDVPEKYKNEIYVCFKENDMTIYDYYQTHNDLTFRYDEIEKIRLSLCTRISSQSLKDGKITSVERNRIGLPTYFYIDLDIEIKGVIYQYESTSLDHMDQIMAKLSSLPQVEDPLGLIEIFQKNTSRPQLENVLMSHLKAWQKEFHIDNPRSFEIIPQVKRVTSDIRKEETEISDIFDEAKMLRYKWTVLLAVIALIAFIIYWLYG